MAQGAIRTGCFGVSLYAPLKAPLAPACLGLIVLVCLYAIYTKSANLAPVSVEGNFDKGLLLFLHA